MTSIPCDIVILPCLELSNRAIALSRQLQRFGALYVLEDGKCYPHASLYMTQLRSDSLERSIQLLAEIAANSFAINLTATTYHQAEGYIDAEYKRDSDIEGLQRKVISIINPIRDGIREKDKVRMFSTTGLARENLEKYGYRGVGELFSPHLSLTRFKDGQDIATDGLPPYADLSGQFTKLGLFEMGDNGTCVRKIAEFEFQS